MNKAIKKIELDLGGKTISLTPEQAKNLKDALDDLFGKEIVRIIEHDSYPLPVPYPVPYPVYPRPVPIPIYPRWEYQPYYYRDSLTACDGNTDRHLCGTDYSAGNYSFDNDTLRLTG